MWMPAMLFFPYILKCIYLRHMDIHVDGACIIIHCYRIEEAMHPASSPPPPPPLGEVGAFAGDECGKHTYT